jgi:hypothetical protein
MASGVAGEEAEACAVAGLAPVDAAEVVPAAAAGAAPRAARLSGSALFPFQPGKRAAVFGQVLPGPGA